MNLIDQIEAQEMKKEVPDIRVGDTVKVHMRIVEGEKERIQVIEGVVLRTNTRFPALLITAEIP